MLSLLPMKRRIAKASNHRRFVSSYQILFSLYNCGRFFHNTQQLVFSYMFNYESCIKEGKTKRRTMIYKILHRKLNFKQHEANKKG
jgi:hypothetical protein